MTTFQKPSCDKTLGFVIQSALKAAKEAFVSSAATSKYNNLLVCLYAAMPLVDSLNGFLLKGGVDLPISVGQAYRLAVVCTLFWCSRRCLDKVSIAAVCAFGAYGFVAVTVHLVSGISPASLIEELYLLAQWSLCPLMLVFLYSLLKGGLINFDFCERAFTVVGVVASLTILVPYAFGVGYSTYSSSSGFTGYKAFYFATNGITFMMSTSFAFAVWKLLRSRKWTACVAAVMCGVSLLLIGTKTAYAVLVMVLILFAVRLACNEFGRDRNRALAILVGVFLIAVMVVVLAWGIIEPVVNRVIYRFNNSESFLSFITSGRTDRIAAHVEALVESKDVFLAFIFGIGDYSDVFSICEMDYFDAFFFLGATGLAVLVAFTVCLLRKCRSFNLFSALTLFSFAYAFVVGHLFTNSLSSSMFCIIVLGLLSFRKDDEPSQRDVLPMGLWAQQ